jgi:hypothetical protein
MTIKKFLPSIVMIIVGLSLISPVLAQQNQLATSSIRISGVQDIIKIINNIAKWMYTILLALVVIFVLVAAFTFLTAGGKTENVKKARNQIMYAVIALVVALLAFSINTIITNILLAK